MNPGTAPMGGERRRKFRRDFDDLAWSLRRKVVRFWTRHHESVGMFFWMIALVIVFAEAIWVYGTFPR